MSSKDVPTTLEAVMERLIRAIEKKKKESKVVPLLEQLFKCWPDHVGPEHAFTLLPLLSHESRHVVRLAFFFLADRRWAGAPTEVRKHVAEAIKKEVYSPTPLKNLFALRTLAALTQADQTDTMLMECSTDILNKILEDKSSKAATASKRKTMSSKDANEQYANDLLQASAFAALRTRPAVDSALWETVVRGILSQDTLTVRHSVALGWRIAKQDASACASLFEPLLGVERPKLIESLADDPTARCYYIRILSVLGNDARVPKTDSFYQELRGFLVDECDQVAFEAIEGMVRGGWGRLQSTTMPMRDEKNEYIPVLRVIISKLSQLMQGSKTPEQHAAVRMTKLLAKAYIVYFEKQESFADFRRPSIAADTRPDISLNSGENSSESLETSATASDSDGDVAPIDARLRKRGSARVQGRPPKDSPKRAKKHSMLVSVTVENKSPSDSSESRQKVSGTRTADLDTSSSASSSRRAGAMTLLDTTKAASFAPPSAGAQISPRRTSMPPSMNASVTADKAAHLAKRKATHTKRRSVVDTEDSIRRQRQEDVEKNHPLNELRQSILNLFKSKGCISVRLKSLTTLIWLTFSWNARKLEETILAERRSLAPHHLDEVCEELHMRVKVTPELGDTILSIFYNLFCSVPQKVNTTILHNVWKTVMETRSGKQKVLHNCFQILDQLHNKETRLITFSVHKHVYWFLGEYANALTGESISSSQRARANSSRGDATEVEPEEEDSGVELVRIEPETEIQNRAMKSVVLRLEQSAVFGPFEIRCASVEALGKIAFRSSWPLKLHLLEFLCLLANEPGCALTHLCVPLLRVLDRIFELRNEWVITLARGKNATPDDKAAFKTDVEELKAEVNSFCKMEQCVLGPDFNDWMSSK